MAPTLSGLSPATGVPRVGATRQPWARLSAVPSGRPRSQPAIVFLNRLYLKYIPLLAVGFFINRSVILSLSKDQFG
jgi:hypothetical protein